MYLIRSAIAGILALLAVASASAQQFPTVPDRSVIGRIGVGGQSGPSQAIPFATLFSQFGAVTLPVTNLDVAIFDGTSGKIKDGGTLRARLSGNTDFYIGRDGNDTCSGQVNATYNVVTNPINCRWLTINKALVAISKNFDFAGFNVVVHINGANVGDGTYTENLILPDWVGYTGNGFGQWIFLGENGVATITGATATATILGVSTASPIQFKNLVLANANASGISVEADDGGFIALHTITFGSTGAAGILAEATQSAGRLLFLASTFTMQSGLTTGTGFLGRSGGEIIFQPGVTINYAGATTFSNAVADFATLSYFDNTGSTWSGTVPTGKPYVLSRDTLGLITFPNLITGSAGATFTPMQVPNGGTGQVSWTSGGIPCANTAVTLASSGALLANAVVYGGGAGGCPSTGAAGTNGQLLLGVTGSPPAWATMGTDATITNAGVLTIANNVVTNAKAAQMAANTIKGNNTGGTANAADLTVAQLSALFTKATSQTFTTGTDATYTTPANATWLEVEIVGGGGGGAGSGTTPGAATSGGNTCWNTSGTACTTPVYQGGGGALGSTAGATSAAGGTVSGSGTCGDSQPGGAGGSGSLANSSYGGIGGSSRYGGAGTPAFGGTNNATAGATNSGSGGGGAGQNVTPNAGGGGGAGAWCLFIQTSPAPTYKYTIGAAGSAGTAGTGGNAGAGGAAGKIRVIEHYN